jgi:hypothetical protein
MDCQSLRDNFAATVDIYSTFIKQMKAENPQLNVSEVSFARRKAGKNSYGKRHSSLRSMNTMLLPLTRRTR